LSAKRKKLKFFAECQVSSTRQRRSLPSVRFLALGKVITKENHENSLPSARSLTLGKEILKKIVKIIWQEPCARHSESNFFKKKS
jgi:hypothetical protein